MKRITVVLILCVISSPVFSCGAGCYEYEGNCACDVPAQSGPSVAGSDEEPRRQHAPAYTSGEVIADMPLSLIYQDAKLDQDRVDADQEGKLAAGIGVGKAP